MSSRRIFNHSRFREPGFDWPGILSILVLCLIYNVVQIILHIRDSLSKEMGELMLNDGGLSAAKSIFLFTIVWMVSLTIPWRDEKGSNSPNQAVREQCHILTQPIVTPDSLFALP